MQPARLDLRVDKGATFAAVLRIMQPSLIYKAITAIAATAPVQITVAHELPTDWPAWVEQAQQLPALNRAPLRTTPHMARVIDANTLEINTINAAGTNAKGGQLIYQAPLDLTGATAVLQLLEDGAAAGTLPVTVNDGGWLDVALTAAQTAALDWAEREYVVDVTLPSGEVLRAFAGTIAVEVAGAKAGKVCSGSAVAGGDKGPRGAQPAFVVFNDDGTMTTILEDGQQIVSDPSPVVETVVSAKDEAVAASGTAVSASAAATVKAGEATAAEEAASVKASEAAASESTATTKAAQASVDAARAESARDASLLSKGVWPTTAAGIGQGVAGTTGLVAGSGGTNGTFDLAFSGGTQVLAPKGRFVVAGGVATQVIIDYPGYYSAGTPTISFTASSGLTGASVSAVMGPNTAEGNYFSLDIPEGLDSSQRYKVDAGPVAVPGGTLPSSQAVNLARVATSELREELGGSGGLFKYVGAGPVIPFFTDANDRVILGYDSTTDSLIGAGIGGSSSGGASAEMQPLAEPVSSTAKNHVITYGQSLSVGAEGKPAISVSQPYPNLTFAGGPRAYTGSVYSFAPLKPLVEDDVAAPDGSSTRGETPCSGLANWATTLRALDGHPAASHVILSSAAGRGGSSILQVKNGTSWYINTFKPHIQQAHDIDTDHAVNAIAWALGETDGANEMTYATHLAELENLRDRIEIDAKLITGQTSPVYWIMYQTAAHSATWRQIQKAQLEFAKSNPKAFISTPIYHLPHGPDSLHLTNIGYKWLGAYYGKSYKTLVDGYQPQWLNPVSATIRGQVLRIRFDVPSLPLVLDTSTLAATTDYGFAVQDDNGIVSMSSIYVEGKDVVIQLASALSGSAVVRYAMDYLGSGLALTSGASGNLRDSEPSLISISGVDRPLYNVAPHFELPVIALGE